MIEVEYLLNEIIPPHEKQIKCILKQLARKFKHIITLTGCCIIVIYGGSQDEYISSLPAAHV